MQQQLAALSSARVRTVRSLRQLRSAGDAEAEAGATASQELPTSAREALLRGLPGLPYAEPVGAQSQPQGRSPEHGQARRRRRQPRAYAGIPAQKVSEMMSRVMQGPLAKYMPSRLCALTACC